MRLTAPLNLPAPGRCHHLYLSLLIVQMAVFLINSRLGLLCDAPALVTARRPHFSRSYVRILPSSLTRVLSCALDCSSRLPVSVSGTVPAGLSLDVISRRHDYIRFASTFSPLAVAACLKGRICLPPSSARILGPGQPSPGRISPHASRPRNRRRFRIMNRIPIGYAFQPRLRGRLTPGRFTLPGKP